MNNKARLIAISGICSAVAVVAILLVSVVPYVVLIMGVLASIAVAVPLLLDGRNLGYSLLVYAASMAVSAVGGVFIGNITYVAPVALFCIPFTIVKVYGESYKVTSTVERTETLEDPFDQGEDTVVVDVEVRSKRRIPTVVKWIVYFLLLEVAIGLTVLFTYLLTPAVFERMYANTLAFWLIIGAAQVFVPLYDALLKGCLVGTSALLNKIVK